MPRRVLPCDTSTGLGGGPAGQTSRGDRLLVPPAEQYGTRPLGAHLGGTDPSRAPLSWHASCSPQCAGSCCSSSARRARRPLRRPLRPGPHHGRRPVRPFAESTPRHPNPPDSTSGPLAWWLARARRRLPIPGPARRPGQATRRRPADGRERGGNGLYLHVDPFGGPPLGPAPRHPRPVPRPRQLRADPARRSPREGPRQPQARTGGRQPAGRPPPRRGHPDPSISAALMLPHALPTIAGR